MAQYAKTTATIRISKLKKRIRAICGGCLSPETNVLMFDLSLKKG